MNFKQFTTETTAAPTVLTSKTGASPYENPDKVIGRKGMQYIELEVERDSKFHSEQMKRITALLKNGWKIEPAKTDGQVSDKDAEVRDFVQECLENMDSEFETDIIAMFSAISRGFSISEKNYRTIEKGRFAGKIGLKNIRHKQQQFFAFKFDNLGYYTLKQINPEEKELDLSKFIHFVYGIDDENPYGQSVASICAFWVWLKKNEAKFWAYYSERFGQPLPVVQVPQNTTKGSDTDRAADDLLYAVHNDTGLKIPKDLAINFLEATRSGDVGYNSFLDRCNSEIALAVNGQTLTSDQGELGRGSHALGSVHAGILNTYTLFDIIISSSAINKQLIRDLVDINFPDIERYPTFRWNYIDFGSFITLAQSLEALCRCNLQIPTKWVYEITGIPVPEGEEKVLKLSNVEQVASNITGIDNKAKSYQQFSNNKAAIATEESNSKKNDRIVSLLSKESSKIFDEIKNKIVKTKKAKIDLKDFTPLVQKGLEIGYLRGVETAQENISQSGKFAEHFANSDNIEAMIERYITKGVVSKSEYKKLSKKLKKQAIDLSEETKTVILDKIKSQIEEVLSGDASTKDVSEKIGSIFQSTGLTGIAPAYLETVLRTNLQTQYSKARNEQFKKANSDDFPSRQVVCVGDDRSRPSHMAFDGFTAPKDDPIWDRLQTPFDYSCRCTIRLVHKSEQIADSASIPDTSSLGFVK